MATQSLLVKVTCVLLICITAPHAEAAIACGTVLARISSCVSYAQNGGNPPAACCDGIKSVYSSAKGTPDIQAICRCAKTFLPRVGAKPELVNSLKQKCNVNVPYTYTPSMDCSKIK